MLRLNSVFCVFQKRTTQPNLQILIDNTNKLHKMTAQMSKLYYATASRKDAKESLTYLKLYNTIS